MSSRFRRSSPCPICGGFDESPRGKGIRCDGFLSDDREYAHCTREEHAGGLNPDPNGRSFAHRLIGDCKCGVPHDPAPPPASNNGHRPRQTIVAAYDYVDEAGILLFQAVRIRLSNGDKKFKQRRPDGHGGWIWKTAGVRRVLYRLPQLIDAVQAGRTIFLPEGEKDVEALVRLGLDATTNAMGAKKFPADQAHHFIGAHVVILEDNDADGRAHTADLYRKLSPVVNGFTRLAFPGLPKGGDVSDWLQAGHTKDELLALVAEASAYEPDSIPHSKDSQATGESIVSELEHFTDLGNARRLVRLFGDDLRYCHDWRQWLIWDTTRWRPDRNGEIVRRAKQTVQALYAEAATIADKDERKAAVRWALASESDGRIQAMISLAESEPRIPIVPEELDADPWLFNCLNGTVDLRSGNLQAHRREHLLTKLAPVIYDPDATCPRWMQFLQQVFLFKSDLIAFVRRAIGYSLTGDVRERVLFITYGKGRNGKSTLLELIAEMLGDYSLRTPTETLMVKPYNQIPNDLAQLPGRRFVHASESEEGKRLSESLIKDLTGRDTISARFMRGEFFQFRPVCKLWLRTNHKPVIRGTDNAIWDRIRLIPFDLRIDEAQEDHELPQRLRSELPGILAWAVVGCLSWQVNGLGLPKEVKLANDAYRAEMDVLADFLGECCTVMSHHLGVRTQSKVLYDAFCSYAGEGMTQTMFTLRLKERGFMTTSINGRAYWQGIGLMTSDEKDV